MTQLDATTLHLSVAAQPAYDIWLDEIVQVALVPELLRSRNPPAPRPRLRVLPATVEAYGSLTDGGASGGAHEAALQNHSGGDDNREPLPMPPTLALVLTGDEWTDDVGGETAATAELLAGLASYQNDTFGWNQVVRPALGAAHVARLSSHTVRIQLPKLPSYQIATPETVSIAVPASATLSGRNCEGRACEGLRPTANITLHPTPGTAVISGPPLDDATEEYLRTSDNNRTLSIQLAADTWDPLVMGVPCDQIPEIVVCRFRPLYRCARRVGDASCHPHHAVARALIGGLASAQSEPGGYNAQMNASAVEFRLLSSTLLQLELPPTPAYDTMAPETISLVVPGVAVVSQGDVVAAPSWVVLPSQGTPSVLDFETNEPLAQLPELLLQSNGTGLVVRMDSDAFVASVDTDGITAVRFIDAFLSAQAEPRGWNAVVRRRLTYESLTLSDDATEVLLDLAPYGDAYDITAPETLSVALPAAVLVSGQPVALAQTVVVRATPGTATVGGSLTRRGDDYYGATVCCGQENFLTDGVSAPTLVITLVDDLWEPDIEYGVGDGFDALRAHIVSRMAEPRGWNGVVQRALRPEHLAVTSAVTARDTLTITLPPLPRYAVDAPEILDVTVMLSPPPLPTAQAHADT